MRVKILAFATAADALGARQLEVELPPDSRLADLESWLKERHPGLTPIWPRLAVAVDGKIAAAEAPLAEGVEVALLPPVSGGAASDRGARARLVETPIDLAALEGEIRDPASGALLLFVGRVRDHHRGRGVVGLDYEAYAPMAERALERIAVELEAASPGLSLRIVHRLGRLLPGEASVAIAVASPHREEAYRASRAALERLKREAPIWKRERYADGESRWREEEPLGPDPVSRL